MNWMSLPELALIHERVIEETGGVHGVTNPGGLESVLERPFTSYVVNVTVSTGSLWERDQRPVFRSRSMKLGLRTWATRIASSLAWNSFVLPLRAARSRRSTSSSTAKS